MNLLKLPFPQNERLHVKIGSERTISKIATKKPHRNQRSHFPDFHILHGVLGSPGIFRMSCYFRITCFYRISRYPRIVQMSHFFGFSYFPWKRAQEGRLLRNELPGIRGIHRTRRILIQKGWVQLQLRTPFPLAPGARMTVFYTSSLKFRRLVLM